MATMIGDVTDLQGRAGGGGGVTLRVRPTVKNSRTPDHQLICLTKKQSGPFYTVPAPRRRQIVAVT